MTKPVVSVIIPAHNAEATIQEQLDALAEQDADVPWDLVVVLNRCTDGTRGIVSRVTAIPITIVEAEEYASASYARNVGAAAAAADYLLFCDADDALEVGWIREMHKALQSADVVGSALLPHPDNPGPIRDVLPANQEFQSHGLFVLFDRIRFAGSGGLGCRRSAFEAVGGFDLDFQYCEDVVFSLEAQRAGFRLGFATNAIYLYRSRTSLSQLTRQRANYSRGQAQLIAKYMPEQDAGIVFDVLGLTVSAVRAIVPFPTSLVRRRFLLLRAQYARVRALASLRSGGRRRGRLLAASAEHIPWTRRIPAVERQRRAWHDQLAAVDFTVPLDVPVLGGLGMLAPLPLAKALARNCGLDETLRIIEYWLEPGDRAVDIGGHVGLVSVAAARTVGEDGEVIAIGFAPHLREPLRRNLERHSGAAGVRLHVGTAKWTPDGPGDDEREVPCVDELVNDEVNLLAIDAAGDAAAILLGASATLDRSPNALIVSRIDLDEMRKVRVSVAGLISTLRNRGSIWVVDLTGEAGGAHRPRVWSEIEHRVLEAESAGECWRANLIVVPRARTGPSDRVTHYLTVSSEPRSAYC